MTTYTFKEFVAWPIGPGGAVQASRGQRVNVTDPATGLTPAGLTQNGQAVTWVTSDGTGLLLFTATASPVDIATPDGTFTRRIEAQETVGAGGSGTVADATTTSEGIVELAGDLGGTALAPTVVGGTHHGHTSGQISGLGGAATLNVGTAAGTVAAGNDSRFLQVGPGVTVTGTPTAGQVPTATSGTAATWQTPAAGGSGYAAPHPTSGEYLFNAVMGGSSNNANAPTSGTLYAVPFYNTGPSFTANGISINNGTAGAAGAVARLGAYALSSNGQIGTLLFDAGTADMTTTGDKTLTISQTIPAASVILLVMVTNDTTCRPRFVGASPLNSSLWWRGRPGPLENTGKFLTYTGYTATSALPSTGTTTGETIATGDVPLIALKAA